MRGKLAEDLNGKRFGYLTVVGRAENEETISHGRVHKRAMWYCQCDCGSQIKKVRASHLKEGRIISCGCIGQKHSREAKIKHDGTRTRLYRIWCNMKNRCYNENVRSYKTYGARGIGVCEEWKNDFQAFRDWAINSGYREDLTIDRINNNGNYEPDNCKWSTTKEQANNTSRSHMITYNGRTMSLSNWARELGINPAALRSRIRNNWPIEKALLQEVEVRCSTNG